MRDTRGSRMLLGLAAVTALALIAIDYSGGSSGFIGRARDVAGNVLGSAERTVSSVSGATVRFFEGGFGAASSGGKVAVLQRQLVRMRAQLGAAALSRAQYAELSGMLRLAGQGGYPVVAASVVGYGQGYSRMVTLDAGSADGVRPQQTVINASGLVGQVVSVSPGTCTVLLASDTTSVVGVALAPGGQVGWVTGRGLTRSGPGMLRLQILDPAAVLRPGQQLVTMASLHDRPFVPGVPVGMIASVTSRAGTLTSQALVRLYVNLSALGVVGIVIAPPRQDPRFSVLPSRAAGH